MTTVFEISLAGQTGKRFWFNVKQKYETRIDTVTGTASCTCEAGMFKLSGRRQEECKHVRSCKKLLSVMGKMK